MAAEWPIIKRGDQDQAVRTLQHLLNHHGTSLEADGVFGPATEEAVKHFQAARGLVRDGVAGPATWESLVVELAVGASGEAVKALQVQLYVRGTLPTVDGEYGVRTDIAVRRFQVFRGLQADGVVRADTWQTLLGTAYIPMAGGEAGSALEEGNDWRSKLLAKIRPAGPNFKMPEG
ncbi:MAG TPA: peptidoglycan-binding protein [Actinomycetota bacterium]|nr:peptidoglycan-binding protein [Actinomycetota bacterium]